MNDPTPKVSVSLITYNHADFIAQAIESILMQETDFNYELIIGEDDSSDGTREIVKSYKRQFPDKIKLFLNSRENVIYIGGKPTGRWNLVNNLRHAQGKYIALLEGDDYWTDPDKLQKQADFLDANPNCSSCFHPVARRYEQPSSENLPEERPYTFNKTAYTLEDLLKGNFVPACSTMFRNYLFDPFPDWYYTVPMGDWPLHVLNAQHGDIGYIDQTMAVYRIHSRGIRSSISSFQKTQTNISTLKVLRHHLNSQYLDIIDAQVARLHLKSVQALMRRKKYRRARQYLFTTLWDRDVSKTHLAKSLVAFGIKRLRQVHGRL